MSNHPPGLSDKSDAHRNERTANNFAWTVMLGDSRATLPAGTATAAPSPASARRRFYSPATAHTSTFSCKTSTTTTRRRLTTRPTTHRCEEALQAAGEGAERFCIGSVQNLAEGGLSSPRLPRTKLVVEEEEANVVRALPRRDVARLSESKHFGLRNEHHISLLSFVMRICPCKLRFLGNKELSIIDMQSRI